MLTGAVASTPCAAPCIVAVCVQLAFSHTHTPPPIRFPTLQRMSALEDKLRLEVGPQFGFDLNHIKLHYAHRRQLRKRYPCLQLGSLVLLKAHHRYGVHDHIFAFARVHNGACLVIFRSCVCVCVCVSHVPVCFCRGRSAPHCPPLRDPWVVTLIFSLSFPFSPPPPTPPASSR